MTAKNGAAQVPARVRVPEFDEFREIMQSILERPWPFGFTLHPRRTIEALAAIDMFERDGKLIVKAEMPGIDPANIDVTIVDGELRMSGVREQEAETKAEHYYRSERAYGRIQRSVTLPEGCDVENVTATTANGVLEVIVPLKQAAPSKKVEVKPA